MHVGGLDLGRRGNLSVHCKIAKLISANYIHVFAKFIAHKKGALLYSLIH